MKKLLFILSMLLLPIVALFAQDDLPDLPGGTDLEAYVATFLMYVASVFALTELISIWVKVARTWLVWGLSIVIGGLAFFLGYGVFDTWYFSILNIAVGGAIVHGYLSTERGKLIIDLVRDLLPKKPNQIN